MKFAKKLLFGLMGLLFLAVLGCTAMLDAVTPCYIDPMEIDYADAEPTSFMPFTTLWDAQRMSRLAAWQWQQDQARYGFIKGLSNIHQSSAKELQTKFMMPAIMGLMTTGALGVGWFGMSKPSDAKKIAKAENKTT